MSRVDGKTTKWQRKKIIEIAKKNELQFNPAILNKYDLAYDWLKTYNQPTQSSPKEKIESVFDQLEDDFDLEDSQEPEKQEVPVETQLGISNFNQVEKIFEENRMESWEEGPRNFFDHGYDPMLKHRYGQAAKIANGGVMPILNNAGDYRREFQKTTLNSQENIAKLTSRKYDLNSDMRIIMEKTHTQELRNLRELEQKAKDDILNGKQNQVDWDKKFITMFAQHKFEKAYFEYKVNKDENHLHPEQETLVHQNLCNLANNYNELNPKHKDRADLLKSIEKEFSQPSKYAWKEGNRNFFSEGVNKKIDSESDTEKQLNILKFDSQKDRETMRKVHDFNRKNVSNENRVECIRQTKFEEAFFEYKVAKKRIGISNTIEHHNELEDAKESLIDSYLSYSQYMEQKHGKEKELSTTQEQSITPNSSTKEDFNNLKSSVLKIEQANKEKAEKLAEFWNGFGLDLDTSKMSLYDIKQEVKEFKNNNPEIAKEAEQLFKEMNKKDLIKPVGIVEPTIESNSQVDNWYQEVKNGFKDAKTSEQESVQIVEPNYSSQKEIKAEQLGKIDSTDYSRIFDNIDTKALEKQTYTKDELDPFSDLYSVEPQTSTKEITHQEPAFDTTTIVDNVKRLRDLFREDSQEQSQGSQSMEQLNEKLQEFASSKPVQPTEGQIQKKAATLSFMKKQKQ